MQILVFFILKKTVKFFFW